GGERAASLSHPAADRPGRARAGPGPVAAAEWEWEPKSKPHLGLMLGFLTIWTSASSMIFCVTLNPCLDKTLTVPPWRPGDSVRGRAVREVVGGKGNNVARALAALGHTARPVTFLG